jgi:hypothetical protein
MCGRLAGATPGSVTARVLADGHGATDMRTRFTVG